MNKTLALVMCMLVAGCTGTAPPDGSSAPLSQAAAAAAPAESADSLPGYAQQGAAISRDWRLPVAKNDAASAAAEWFDDASSLLESAPGVAMRNSDWVADWGVWADNTDDEAVELYRSIPKDLALRYEFGDSAKNELLVFTDPYAQKDRRFYRILMDAAKKIDATVYMLPLLGSTETGSVSRILCAQQPEQAWWDWISKIAPTTAQASSLFPIRITQANEDVKWSEWEADYPQVSSCDSLRAEKISQLATDLGVSHTPTVVFANGRAWPFPDIELSDIQENWRFVSEKQHLDTLD